MGAREKRMMEGTFRLGEVFASPGIADLLQNGVAQAFLALHKSRAPRLLAEYPGEEIITKHYLEPGEPSDSWSRCTVWITTAHDCNMTMIALGDEVVEAEALSWRRVRREELDIGPLH